MSWSEDTSGVKVKPPPASFGTDLNNFSTASEWIKTFLMKHIGVQVVKVLHDAYSDMWRFYDADDDVIVNIDHELMRRLALVLEQIDWMTAEAQLHADDMEEYEQFFGEEDGS